MGKEMALIDFFLENKQILSWHENLPQKQRQLLLGLSGSAKSLAIASSLKSQDKILVMTSTYGEAERLINDLISILGSDLVYPFLVDDSPMVEFLVSSQEKIFSRVEALRFLRDESQRGILVCNVAASRVFLPNPQVFDDSILELQVGQECEQRELKNHLISLGYKKVTQVQSQGEFSLRGDILDIFETSQICPYRIEFFGDEIDGIREFDTETQLSKDSQTQVLIYPASDILLTNEDYHRGQKFLEHEIDKALSPTLKSYIEEVFSCMKEQVLHADIRKFLSVFYKKQWTLMDYLNQVPVIFDDFQKIMNQYDAFDKEIASYFTDDLHNSKSVSNLQYFADVESQFKKYVPATFFSNFQKGLGNLKFNNLYQFNQYPMQEFFNQFSFLKEEIERYKRLKYTVVLQSSSKTELKKLSTILDEYDIKVDNSNESEICKGTVNLIEGNLRHGFHFVDENLVFITEYEIFKKKIKRKYRRQNISNAERLKDYNELQKGDYVVHQIHGIGQYLGIETIEIKGIHRDYVSVLYQNGDRISIPVEQIQTLSKYVSSDGKAPKLNKLNDGRFKKAKQKVKSQVEDIADDLIKLYAERSQLKGFAFSKDDEDQNAFDEAFPYVETEDQLRSIEEIKKDMQAPQPMDRLLVGDVGFGKTEVAMRAAFKAVNDHKQVVVLVPTTVLAQQHYSNFKERFEQFAVNVDVLSRFRSKKEQTETLEKLNLKPNVIVAAIYRNNQVITPSGKDVIQKGDSVIVITTNTGLGSIDDIIAE